MFHVNGLRNFDFLNSASVAFLTPIVLGLGVLGTKCVIDYFTEARKPSEEALDVLKMAKIVVISSAKRGIMMGSYAVANLIFINCFCKAQDRLEIKDVLQVSLVVGGLSASVSIALMDPKELY